MAQANISVAIVGGGIGGLAAALSLLRAGFDVQVYEQARALGEAGARPADGGRRHRLVGERDRMALWP